ncbi:hypothetical protein B1H18_29230 [Streptomyces tsukubensis]|uniref:Uncharacterized protein n=1 Tax=Streptomyces tsukubensis TaxID=83656 RepID=A0A1V4A1X1_9ACTN|nr:hypothetical protein B1H18_29230 [Streptomyces tsukubensis]
MAAFAGRGVCQGMEMATGSRFRPRRERQEREPTDVPVIVPFRRSYSAREIGESLTAAGPGGLHCIAQVRKDLAVA